MVPTLSQDYGYDAAGRLVAQTMNGTTMGLAYDGTGNRTQRNDAGAVTAYAYAAGSHRLQSASSASLARQFTTNALGNLTSWTGADGVVQQMSYDTFQRPATHTRDGIITKYRFNAQDQRVMKSQAGGTVTHRYVYAGQNTLLAERFGNASTGASQWTSYLWLGGQPVGLVKGNTLYWVTSDHLGRPEVVTNASQQVVWRAANQAFDRSVLVDQIGGLRLGFPGQSLDAESGLWHNGFRDYDASLGRYVQSDPVGLAGGWSTYGYVGGNPLTFSDPTGLIFGFDTGECAGAEAAQYWADRATESGNPLYHIPGAVAALWTPGTSDKTATVLSLGFGGAGVVGAGFRIEMGAWKQGGKWIAGGPNNRVLHGHFGTGPGMGKHHLPYQTGNWAKNFLANIQRGAGGQDAANVAKVVGGAGGAATVQMGSGSPCGCD